MMDMNTTEITGAILDYDLIERNTWSDDGSKVLKRLLLFEKETKGGIPGYLHRRAPATISQVHTASLAASPATSPADILPHSWPCWIWKDASTNGLWADRVIYHDPCLRLIWDSWLSSTSLQCYPSYFCCQNTVEKWILVVRFAVTTFPISISYFQCTALGYSHVRISNSFLQKTNL